MREAPESMMRAVVDECADCDVCRFLMDTSCTLFPALYRLWDRKTETGTEISNRELRALADSCHFCALCPCPPVREKILRAKAAFVRRDGLPRSVRLIEDVALLGNICGAWPKLTNTLFRNRRTGGLAKRSLGIHPERNLPAFPRGSFFHWARKRGLQKKPAENAAEKTVYFAGCTAAYLYPEVARAAVSLLSACGCAVWVPPQRCCGMPALLEGDLTLALKFVAENVEMLSSAVADGFQIVCSCPTCGYFLKSILPAGAHYDPGYQASVGGDGRYLMVPASTGGAKDPRPAFRPLDRTICGGILRDAGAFSGIDARNRIAVSENIHDLGDVLLRYALQGRLTPGYDHTGDRAVYFPPCHLREQKIGRPWETLISRISGMKLESVGGELYCCGMGGIMGFKRDFHDRSLRLGRQLMEKIRTIAPDRIITDCLSCRLQFNQCLPYPVSHPARVVQDALAPAGTTGGLRRVP